MTFINEFFCSKHFIAVLADIFESALRTWDQVLYDGKPVGSLANGGYSKND